MAPVGISEFKKIIKNRLLQIAFQFFFPAFLGHYLVAKNKQIAGGRPIFF